MYEKLGDYTLALVQYQTIIDQHKECIYVDENLKIIIKNYQHGKILQNCTSPLEK